jgi:hypothetical protein
MYDVQNPTNPFNGYVIKNIGFPLGALLLILIPLVKCIPNNLFYNSRFQRGHQNMLESHYQVIMFLLLGGLRFPVRFLFHSLIEIII